MACISTYVTELQKVEKKLEELENDNNGKKGYT